MQVQAVTGHDMLQALERSRSRLRSSSLSSEDRARAEALVDRDEAILRGARGETLEAMRSKLQLARNLTAWAQVASMAGIALTCGAGLFAGLSPRLIPAGVALFGFGGGAVMAYATFGLQKPVVEGVLDSLAPELELLEAQRRAPQEVRRLAEGSEPGQVVLSDDGVLVGGVFLPVERDERLFHT